MKALEPVQIKLMSLPASHSLKTAEIHTPALKKYLLKTKKAIFWVWRILPMTSISFQFSLKEIHGFFTYQNINLKEEHLLLHTPMSFD